MDVRHLPPGSPFRHNDAEASSSLDSILFTPGGAARGAQPDYRIGDPHTTHRAPSLGRHCPHRALLRQHASKDRHRHLRQPRRKSSLSPPFAGLSYHHHKISPNQKKKMQIMLIEKQKKKKTSLLRALAPTTPTYVYPAMNTLMYEHPLTAQHVRTVRDVIGYHVVGPISKGLACGDCGRRRDGRVARHRHLGSQEVPPRQAG